MLYHSIINSEEKRTAESMVIYRPKYNPEQTLDSRVNSVSKEIGVDVKVAEKMRKSAWKKLIKQKDQGFRDKTKSITIKDEKWERRKPFLDVTRMSMSTVSFLAQLDSGILCL